MNIKIFTPPKFTNKPLDIEFLNNLTNKKWRYASTGRASIYHILKSLNVDTILIPVYICHTILTPLKKLGITPVFYDIDNSDLNSSLESIKIMSKKYDIKTLLVASMYGNPANLYEIEKYCKDNSIFLIDDAAQSFGAKLNDKYIGTFGDAGFFSFSPGKPTAGHMGSFFWSKNSIEIKRTSHCLTHYFRWLDIDINRNKIYKKYNRVYKKLLSLISKILLKFMNIDNDNICKFEDNILGGILYDNLNNKFSFRQIYQEKFIITFESNKYFRVLHGIRGMSNNHKFIILFYDRTVAYKFINFMLNNKIYVSNGYKLLSNQLLNAKDIDGKIIEIPIEDYVSKMDYVFRKVKEFENRD